MRPGYRLLRIVPRAPDAKGEPERATVVYRASDLRPIWRRGRHAVLVTDGADLEGPEAADDLTRAAGMWARQGVRTSVVGVAGDRFDDATLERIARLGGGVYHAAPDRGSALALASRVADRVPSAQDVSLVAQFEPAAVRRYRMLGWEGRGVRAAEAPPSVTLASGAEVVLLFEVRAAAPMARIGTVYVRWSPPGGAVRTDSLAIRPGPPQSPQWGVALASAAVAEKLRGSSWARHLSWSRLRALVDEIADGHVALARMIEAAARIDRRPDRFAADLPVASMGFDALPVVR